MGNLFSREKNDPKVNFMQIEQLYKLAKGEIESLDDLELYKSFKSESV
jgi:hypothetical protein